jgi:hypothetical protein
MKAHEIATLSAIRRKFAQCGEKKYTRAQKTTPLAPPLPERFSPDRTIPSPTTHNQQPTTSHQQPATNNPQPI